MISSSIPGCNGDVLLNIISVKLWLSVPTEQESAKAGSKADFATTLGRLLGERVNKGTVQPGGTRRGSVPRPARSTADGSVANEQQATAPKPNVHSTEPQQKTVEDLKEASAKGSSRVSTASEILSAPRSARSADDGSVANEQQATAPKPSVRSAEPQIETTEDLTGASAQDSARVSTACEIL